MRKIDYSKKSIPQLIAIADKWCHKYIRLRDHNKPCVSCGQFRTIEAGHFYSGGHYPVLRFNQYNIHGQCKHCNQYLHGNLNEYRRKIVDRIGTERLSELDLLADMYKRNGFKWDRFGLIETIEKFRILIAIHIHS